MTAYFSEETDFVLKEKIKNRRWLKLVCESEIRRAGDINIIFCSDNYLLDINKRFLSHDYYTDIITFDYCEGDKISGDMFISVDTVRANAGTYGEGFDREIHRVMVHGVLHLVGYDDHTVSEKKIMRGKEDYYLSLYDAL